jgi:tetratricopeptide (TPR) repeat protein
MTRRRCWLCLCALSLLQPALFAAPLPEPSAAVRLWEQGQAAMGDGRTDEAIRFYSQSLRLEPQLARNYLSLAAAHVSRGEEAEAAAWLSRYVAAQPQHHVIRLHYAELLLRLGKTPEGRAQLERFIVDVQDRADLADAHLLDCHTRLVQLAEADDDDYGEHLNRGIGLYLLACQRALLPEVDADGFSTEALLCRSAAELGLARRQRPEEARPCWYLHQVWSRLAQHYPASRCLRAAEAAAPFSYLTPAEQRCLRFACRQRDAEGREK